MVKILRSVMFVLGKFDLVDSVNTRLGEKAYYCKPGFCNEVLVAG
jgi:hypothetical protein